MKTLNCLLLILTLSGCELDLHEALEEMILMAKAMDPALELLILL